MSPKWLLKGPMYKGELITAPCSEIKVAVLLGSHHISELVVSTERPTMHEAEEMCIKNSVKFAEIDE